MKHELEESWRSETDGRRQRSLRTRAQILDALVSLVEEGVRRPTAREIALRAGVALRSLKLHFTTREALLGAAAMHMGARIARGEPVDATLPLDLRIEAFARSRADFLEASRTFRLASQAIASESKVMAQTLDAFVQARRADVGRVFALELARRCTEDRPVLLDTLDLTVSGRVWDGMRDELGLSPTAARSRVEHMLRVLLV